MRYACTQLLRRASNLNPAYTTHVFSTTDICPDFSASHSNLLSIVRFGCTQACSILYKSKLPMLLVFNKTDVSRHEFALDWMADFETFHVALQADSSYASTLSKSLSLVSPNDMCC